MDNERHAFALHPLFYLFRRDVLVPLPRVWTPGDVLEFVDVRLVDLLDGV